MFVINDQIFGLIWQNPDIILRVENFFLWSMENLKLTVQINLVANSWNSRLGQIKPHRTALL